MKEKYKAAGLRVISVHTPEFDFEKDRKRVEKSVARYRLDQPVYLDNDYAYWNALGNRYWPAFYLVDKAGNMRTRSVGELHPDTERGDMMEGIIRELLRESPS